MKHAVLMSLLILALGGLVFSACQPLNKTMTLQDMYGACRTSASMDCGPINQDALCNEYVGVLSQAHPDAKSCRHACQQVQNRHMLNVMPPGLNCRRVSDNMVSACMQYCNGQYANQ